jgi:hypothetical protein
MSGTGDSEDKPRRVTTEAPRERLLLHLQAVRDNLCHLNVQNSVQGDRYASGYGAGVEEMWEAAEDIVKVVFPEREAASS